MPGGIRSTAGGVVRSCAVVSVAVVLAVATFAVQAPELVLAAGRGCVTPGNDGPNAALTGVVNSYYPATASAASGATAISVGARIPAASPAIAAGDLLLVIQMQDADISGTNAITYGDGASGRGSTGLRSTGLYEYVAATSAVVAGTVNIAGSGGGGGLVNSYDFSTTVTATNGFRTFQVIRVPQYSSATVTAGLTATAWSGSAHAGGILAIDVAGALNLNSQTISVNQLGFKGGLGVAQAGGPDANTDYVVASQRGDHGYKAEGIAGTPHFLYDPIANAAVTAAADGYPSGDAARGAPGTAGGGGTDANPVINDQNSGGGGGANGGQGGMGGNSWNTNLPVGGLGGALFPAAAARVVLGGGGGAGSRNNSPAIPQASSGGTGGGIVMIRAGTLTGTGTITANGGVGVTPDNDGGGGGGAGGSVVVSTNTGTVNGLTIGANGGNGTDAWPAGPAGTANRHGPGGGGGGGVIITSNALPAGQTSVLGGAPGITTNGAADHYGATGGNPGVLLTTTLGAIPGSSSGGECLPVLTATKSTSTPNVTNTANGTAATYAITVSNGANVAPATGVSISDALPSGFTYASTLGIGLNGGATRPATVNPAPGDTNPTFGTFSIPASGSVVITFTVNIAASVTPGTYNNPAAATYLDPTRTTTTGTTSTTYPGGGPERVTVGLPDMTIAKNHTDPFVRGSTTATYALIATNSGGAASVGAVTVADTLPPGLTPTAVAGTGWTCPAPIGQAVTCTRADALAGGSSYPPITITVTVLQSAANSVTNQATVSGGGESNAANNTATDPTNIISLPGLPNTSGAAAPVAPNARSNTWLVVLSLVAGVGGLAVAIGVRALRSTRARFRQRRRRPAFGAAPVLLSLLVCSLGLIQLAPSATRSMPASTTVAPPPIAVQTGAELIGTTVVTQSRPAAPVEESFHVAAGPITPSRLRIPSIAVDAPVAGVGLLKDGSMAVPDNLWSSAWLSSSARPGQAGKAVIAGHRGIGTPGLFSHLENVHAGDRIHVSDAAGGELVYEVTSVALLDLSVATQLQVFGPTTQQQLVLITCFGEYSSSTRTYDHRLVVFSKLLPGAA
jgi:LPXTG-site transpeptidase (sortase) family protein